MTPGALEVEDEIAKISGRIRRWREEASLTLQELAKRSGLATSTVQKVETGQMIPSVAVLLKLSHGLGRRPSELIHEGDSGLDVAHLRAGQRDHAGSEQSMSFERLSGDLSEPALEMWRVCVQPGASSGDSPVHYEGEELVVCEKGQITFCLAADPNGPNGSSGTNGKAEDEYALNVGDSLHFKARLPHRWENRGRGEARFTVTGTLPAKFRALIRTRVARAV